MDGKLYQKHKKLLQRIQVLAACRHAGSGLPSPKPMHITGTHYQVRNNQFYSNIQG